MRDRTRMAWPQGPYSGYGESGSLSHLVNRTDVVGELGDSGT